MVQDGHALISNFRSFCKEKSANISMLAEDEAVPPYKPRKNHFYSEYQQIQQDLKNP